MLIHRHRLNILSRIWSGPPGMEGFGNLILALDDESPYTESTPGNNDVIKIEDRSVKGPTISWDASNGLVRNPASGNFGGCPTLWRGNAGEWFNRTTGVSDISGNELTFAFSIRPTNLGGQCMPFDNKVGGTGSGVGVKTNGVVTGEPLAGTYYDLTPAGTILVSTVHLVVVTFLNNSYFQAWVDGTKYSQVGTPTAGITINQVWSSLTASGDWESAGLYIYEGVLSDAKVAEVGQFLSDKLGLGQTW